MLPFELLLSVITGFTVIQGIDAMPSHRFSVELQSCVFGSEAIVMNTTALEQCVSLCQQVQDAQTECHGLPDCTCEKAPPLAVQSCLQCHIQAVPEYLTKASVVVVPSKLNAYSLVCGGPLKTPLHSTELRDTPDKSLLQRESGDDIMLDVCLYGLPKIVFMEPVAVSTWKNPWFFVVVIGAFILYGIDSWRKAKPAES
ncbi:hypothetical protein C8Q75DRAFT_767143 [Abortiporus biennis]|nr:hypothetical protein C8Q75DRAFT_767143 [Abortiporus biennis]